MFNTLIFIDFYQASESHVRAFLTLIILAIAGVTSFLFVEFGPLTMTGSSCSTQAICYMGIALGSALGIKLFCLSR